MPSRAQKPEAHLGDLLQAFHPLAASGGDLDQGIVQLVSTLSHACQLGNCSCPPQWEPLVSAEIDSQLPGPCALGSWLPSEQQKYTFIEM